MPDFLSNLDFTVLLIVFVTLVISITLHEAMHAFAGHWLGDDTAQREGRITLNPLKHIDPYMTILLPLITLLIFKVPLLAAKPVPFNPNRVRFDEYGAALIAVAGPLTNLLLAICAAGILNLFGGGLGFELQRIVAIFLIINVGLFVFNMIPIPPLDGSRVLYAFAPDSLRNLLYSIEHFGILIVFGLVLAFPPFTAFLSRLNQIVTDFLL
jgi:Zn-dependent protease